MGLRSKAKTILTIKRDLNASLNNCILPLRILTHNIRSATTTPGVNEKPLADRLSLILNELSYNARNIDGTNPAVLNCGGPSLHVLPGAAFVCLQEVLHVQVVDILNGLNNKVPTPGDSNPPDGHIWAHLGVGRTNGKTEGEYSPILYPVQALNLIYFEAIWLTPTQEPPHVPAWDAGTLCILTVGVFEHKLTKQRLVPCCTHLDEQGVLSRKISIPIILDTINRVRNRWTQRTASGKSGAREEVQDIAVFLAGDFNSRPDQEAYQMMQSSGVMCGLRSCIDPLRRYGDQNTFTGFDPLANEQREN